MWFAIYFFLVCVDFKLALPTPCFVLISDMVRGRVINTGVIFVNKGRKMEHIGVQN